MKYAKLVLIVSAMSISGLAIAHEKPADLPACQGPVKACEAGGFTIGGHKHGAAKGVWADCIGKVAHGKSVANVTLSQSDAQACHNAAKALRHGGK